MERIKIVLGYALLAGWTVACAGEKRVYDGTLKTTVVRSGSGETVVKSGSDSATLTFKTVTADKIKSELDYCTVELINLGGDSWTARRSKECDVEGASMAILNGRAEIVEGKMSLELETLIYGTGKSNKYSFGGNSK